MKRYFIFITGFLFILLTSRDASATHMMGSDITYRSLDSCRYEITVAYYRWCAGVSLSTPNATLECLSSTGGVTRTKSLALTLSGITEITPLCKTAPAECTTPNTQVFGAVGVEKHVYKTTINLCTTESLFAGCNTLRIVTGQCCRNGNITTGMANERVYTCADIEIGQTQENSSPTFSKDPSVLLC